VGIIKRQLVLLSNFKGFGMGVYSQSNGIAVGLDGIKQVQCLLTFQLEQAQAKRGDFVQDLHTDCWLMRVQLDACTALG